MSKKHGKKVILSEWGPRLLNPRADVLEYVRFMKEESAKRGIEWMYYCGVFNNAWTFSLYTSEYGFEKTSDIVEMLTGEKPGGVVPPTNQVNNSSFMMDTEHWHSNGQVTLGTADGQGVDGSRALRCMVMFVWPKEAVIYQQTRSDWRFYAEGFYMLQLRQGNSYNLSLYAKSSTNTTKLSVQLGNADNDPVLWRSEPVEIDKDLTKYEFTYVHEGDSIENARLSIFFADRHSEVILDEIRLVGTRPQQ